MTASHPSGMRGYLFQSYGPFRALYANMAGLTQEVCIMLSVFITCGVRRSHNCRGELLSVVVRAAINTSLKVWIARSAALTRWLCRVAICTFFHQELFDVLCGLVVHDIEFYLEAPCCELVKLHLACHEYWPVTNPVMGSARMLFDS